MNIPEKPTNSISTSTSVTFNPAIPVVVHISSAALEKSGWSRSGMTWEKWGETVIFDGSGWRYNGHKVEFMQDLNQEKK